MILSFNFYNNKSDSKKGCLVEEDQRWTCAGQTRYLILALSTLCLSLVVANSMLFNFTVICMRCVDEQGRVPTPSETHSPRFTQLDLSSPSPSSSSFSETSSTSSLLGGEVSPTEKPDATNSSESILGEKHGEEAAAIDYRNLDQPEEIPLMSIDADNEMMLRRLVVEKRSLPQTLLLEQQQQQQEEDPSVNSHDYYSDQQQEQGKNNNSVISSSISSGSTMLNTARKNDELFTMSEEGWLFSAVAIGTLIGTLPITKVTLKFGVRAMVTSYGLVCSFAALATPAAVQFGGFWGTFLIRVAQGFAVATSYLAMGAISAEWSPLRESGLFVCIISCHFQLGPILAMPLAGVLCSSAFGWPMAYYTFGTLSLFSFMLFAWFFRDTPMEHQNVGREELDRIQLGKINLDGSFSSRRKLSKEEKPNKDFEKESDHSSNKSNKSEKIDGKRRKTPYLKMLSDPVVWAVFVSNLGATFGNQIFVQYGPLYLNKALGMTIQKTGFSAALPFLFAALMKLVAGPLSDCLGTFLSEKVRVILFISVSQYIMAGLFLVLVFTPADQPIILHVCFTLVTMFAGLWQVGAVRATQSAAGPFSPAIFSMNTFTSYAIVLGLPAMVNGIAPESTLEQWGRIFMVIAVIQVLATTFFNFTVDTEPRAWSKPISSEQIPHSSSSEKKMSLDAVVIMDKEGKQQNQGHQKVSRKYGIGAWNNNNRTAVVSPCDQNNGVFVSSDHSQPPPMTSPRFIHSSNAEKTTRDNTDKKIDEWRKCSRRLSAESVWGFGYK